MKLDDLDRELERLRATHRRLDRWTADTRTRLDEAERIFAEAHRALYAAPTDLGLVLQLVRRYQELLNAARPEPEAVR